MRLARTGALATLERGRRAADHAGRRRQRLRRRAAHADVDAVAPYEEPRPRPARLASPDRARRARRPAQPSAPNPRRRDRRMSGGARQGPVSAAQSQGRRSTPASPISPSTASGSRTCISTAASAAPPRSRLPTSSPRARARRRWREAEERLLNEANALGARRARAARGHKAVRPAWRAIGLDAEGLDLAAGGRAGRAQFAAPAHDPEAWRARLEELLAAR